MSTDTETIDDLELDDQIVDDGADDGDDDEPKGLSLRDSLEKAWEKHGGELPEERKSARDRRRDKSDDRFDKQNARSDKPRDATDKGAPGKQVSDRPEGQDGAATQPPTDGPSAWWKKDGKALWDRLDPQAKSLLTQRENLITQGARQLQERYGGIHRLTQSLAPRFQRYNLTPDRGFANMASWFEAIENNPTEGIRALAQLYKVDASKLGAAATQHAPGATNGQTPPLRPPADPRLDRLERWAAEMQQTRSNEVQLAKLHAWSPSKPHFDKVRSLMGDLLASSVQNQDPRFLNEAGTDIDLDKLYEAAIQVHPEVGLLVINEKAKAEREARQRRIAEAKRAGGSLRPGTPGGAPLKGEQQKKLPKGSTVRAHLQQAWDELRSS